MKNVLITGAAGFLGSHLMLHHLKEGDRVLGIDNFCSSSPDSEHVKKIRSQCSTAIDGSINGVIRNVDICDDEELHNAYRLFNLYENDKLDILYNFACPASPPIYQSIPVLTTRTCTTGVVNVLDLAKKYGATVVHASTSEIYGDPTASPQQESHWGNVNSYGPRSCYDEGKRCAEALCYDYLNSYSVDVRLVRIFNTYGPHMDPFDGRVVSNFIRQALKGEKLTIYGSGSQTRSFCYVDDLIKGIVEMGKLEENPKTPINLGNPNEFTMNELAAFVLKKVHENSAVSRFGASDSRLVTRCPLPKDDPKQRCPDITLAKQLLKWEPRVQIGQGLDKTIEYFKQIVK